MAEEILVIDWTNVILSVCVQRDSVYTAHCSNTQ